MTNLELFACRGGRITLPARGFALVGRQDGGNLCVEPPREVWERSELTAAELTSWSFLVAAAGWAMLDVLPQLDGGCINYWEAGNWALNDQAEPRGPKRANEHRRVHLHLLGRSRAAADPSWRWGEAPVFPVHAERATWTARFERLTPQECLSIVARTAMRLKTYYGIPDDDIAPWLACQRCGYPTVTRRGQPEVACVECLR